MKNIKNFKSFNESDGSYQLPNGDVTSWIEQNSEEIMNYLNSLSEEEASIIDQECKSADIEELENQNESLHIGSTLRKLISYFYNKYKSEKGIRSPKSFLVFASALIIFLSSCNIYVGNTSGYNKNRGTKSYRKHTVGTDFRCRGQRQTPNLGNP